MIASYFGKALLLIPLALACGCGPTSPAVSDIDAATKLLNSTFESWKSGQPGPTLRYVFPPVYVSEEMWDEGFLLSDFTIDGAGEVYGTNVRLRVTLNGKKKDGAAVNRQVTYLVTTTPALTIARTDR
jgi:hypothetical protein